jgi:hypothetical protein
MKQAFSLFANSPGIHPTHSTTLHSFSHKTFKFKKRKYTKLLTIFSFIRSSLNLSASAQHKQKQYEESTHNILHYNQAQTTAIKRKSSLIKHLNTHKFRQYPPS